MRNTKIQWCDDTCNPVMGCEGCELWASQNQICRKIAELLAATLHIQTSGVSATVKATADLFADLPRKDLIANTVREIARQRGLPEKQAEEIIAEVKGTLLKCYAGNVTSIRQGWHSGYPATFEQPTCFPGRMAKAAAASDLHETERAEKPWLNGLPRLIFVSDMGDALSSTIPFEYLREEIISVAVSPNGLRHDWLWLTKRPRRMAEFSRWLSRRGVAWPNNLMAMTSVTSQRTLGRVEQLQRVNCRMRGLSVEPLWTPVTLPLEGIDWVIVGGESGKGAEPFHLEWASDIREQCQRAGVAFFLKQLGRRPSCNGVALELDNLHGGDWIEWPEDLRVREMPQAFRGEFAVAA